MAKSEFVTVRIDSSSETEAELLPDVLRQLNAMVRLLTDFATDPTVKVQVVNLAKHSPLQAELRVVRIAPAQKPAATSKPTREPKPRPYSQPVKRLVKVYDEITSSLKPRRVDAQGLGIFLDVAKLLKDDIATVETESRTIVVSKAIIDQIDNRLGPIHRAYGTVTGVLEGLNVHSQPLRFVIYPDSGPPRGIRCNFADGLFPDVQRGIRHMVTVHGLKSYVAGSRWPMWMDAERIEVRAEAKPGAWLDLVGNLERLWDSASEDERIVFQQEHTA